MTSAWVELLQSARKSALNQDGKRKVHFELKNGTELSEEYNLKTNELLVRKWRKRGTLGGIKPWEIEIGESDAPIPTPNAPNQHIQESFQNPICVRLDTKRAFLWRIRNLPYPLATYDVKVEQDNIVVRTKNKKYFKKIAIPDMERYSLHLDGDMLTFAHANNTLIIQYQKPKQIMSDQELLIQEFRKLKSEREGDVDCNQS